jgi:Zn finger protein HypA/HybF involved in hydrogenase expression
MRFFSIVVLFALPVFSAPAAKDSCNECHLKLRGKLKAASGLWENDVHGQNGMTCAICHKGDATVDDLAGSKTPDFIGMIPRHDIAKLCGDCHADAQRIHQANAKLPVDQLAKYQASVHAKRFAIGDEAAATCTDCHGTHDVRRISDPLSRVAPLLQPDTCGRCHSDPAVMEGRKLPVNQVEEYRQGAHWTRLSVRGDPKSARCTSCHSNHNIAPAKTLLTPATCQPCHGTEAEVFGNRAHSRLEDSERSRGCVACHGDHANRRRAGGGRGRPVQGQNPLPPEI